MAEEIEYEALDADFLQLTQVTSNTTIKITEPFEDLDPYISLLAISNKYGFLIIGSSEGFIYTQIKDCINQLTSEEAKEDNVKSVELRNKINVKIDEAKVQQIALSEDQLTLIIGLKNNKIKLYNISQLINEKENTKFFKEYSYESSIKSIRSNPKNNNTFAVLLENNKLKIENYKDNSTIELTNDSTSMAWSLDGEFIFTCNNQGEIEKLSMSKEKSQTIALPASLENFKIIFIVLQSDDVISALYFNKEESIISTCIFIGVKNNNIKIIKCEDPCYGDYDKEQCILVNNLSQISKNYPSILCFGNTTSPDIGIIGEKNSEWSNWTFPDNYQVSVPLGANDEDCYPYGMVVDYTSDIKLPGATPDEPEKEPVPILWIFDSFGRLNGYHCVISDDNEKCSLMTTPIPIPQYTEALSSEQQKQKLGFGSSLLNNSTYKPSTGFSFGFSKTDDKSTSSNVGLTPKTENKPVSNGFSFAIPKTEEKPASSGFNFATPKTEGKPTSAGFSFAIPKTEDKPASAGFSFAIPKTENKPTSAGFSFAIPKIEDKPASSGFNIATPKAEDKPVLSNYSFAKSKAEEKPMSTGFNFATTKANEKLGGSPFSGLGISKPGEKPVTGFNFMNSSTSTGFNSINVKDKEINVKSSETISSFKSLPVSSKSPSFLFNKSNEKKNEENKTTGITLNTSNQTSKLNGFAFKTTIDKKVEPQKAEVKKTIPTKPVIKEPKVKIKPPSSSNYNHRFVESFNNNYLKFSEEIENFKEKINTTIKNINDFKIETCSELSKTDLADCSLSNGDSISNEIKELQGKVDNINDETIKVNDSRLNILTELVKIEAKKTEIFKLLNSIKNNSYKKVNMELGLSPEIEEAQSKIRSKVFKIENDIKDISEIIINFRKKLNKKADLIMEVPDLDKIYRSILYITQHTIKISNSLRTFDIEIRKYENDLVLNNKSLLFNSSKQTQKIEKSLEPILYNNLLKNENKNEIKDTSNEKKISQKIQFKSLLKIALTSGRNTFLNDNVKKVDSITIVRQDDTEDEESEDYSDGKENNLSQKHYDSSEYDTNEDFDEYLKESNENDGNDDEDNDIIDDEFDDEYDKPALNGFNWAAAGMKKPVDPEGTWECPSCMVKNKPDATQCIACETDKPGAKKSDDLKTVPTFGSNKLGISFGKPSSSKPTDSSTPSTSGFNWAAAGMKKPVDPEGTWECPSCMVKNKPDATQCIACETDKPGAKKSDDLKTVPTFGSNKLGISFGKPSSSKPTDSSTPSTSGFNWAAAGMKKPVDPEGTWECPSCMVKNKPDATQCIACETDKPGAKKSDDLKTVPTFGSNNLGISFGKPSSSKPTDSSTPSTSGFNWAAAGMKKPVDPEGTWECPSCMVKNKPDATQCIACETDKPGAKKSDDLKTVPTFGSNNLGISFGKPSSSKPTDSSTPSTSGFNWAAAGMKKPVDPEGTWECPSCMVKNKPDATQCIACETDKPGAKKSDDLKTVPTFGSNKLGISFGKPTPTEEIKSDETPKPFESNSIGFSFGNSSSTENKNEEKKKDFETSFGSTESTKSNIGFSFANSNYTEQKNDTNEKIDNINQEKDQNNKNNDEDLDIDTTTEKIGSLGGNSFGFNSSSKNETHNVFGISTTKSTTTSVFGQTSDNNSSSFNSFVSSNTTTSASPFNNSNTFTKNAASVFGNNNTFSNNNTTNSVFNNNSSTSNSFGNSVVTPSFGQSSFGQSSTFNKPAFGQTTAFGQSTSNSVFGQTSSIGNSVMNSGFSSFTNQNNQSTSEKPVFGSSTQIGFGNTSMLGMNSAFGTPSAFGSGSTFSSVMNTSNLGSGKGFSAFSNNNETSFSSLAHSSNNNNGESIFGNGGSFDTSKNQFGFGNSGIKNSSSFSQYR
ncbi:hypothetical protein H8356DRAFT_611250 [Neocallimastix lanati (nom. inval.)]|nr:hypothetical protein H8356DRAFT_611250 [Neocallimastix sp. JGI-2020a]